MKIKTMLSLLVVTLLFTTVVYGEDQPTVEVDQKEVTTEVETEVETEVVTEENTEVEVVDLEVLDRIKEYEMRFKGTKDMSETLLASINASIESNTMPIDIIVNNQYLDTDMDALIIDNRTYVPFRAVVEAFNLEDVAWNKELYKATFRAGEQVIELLINTPRVIIDGQEVLMDTPSLIIEGRTMVPIRFISEFLGFNVEWDNIYYTVSLTHDTFTVNEERLNGRFYSVDELKTFSKLVYKEAGSVSYETKHGVASVVMNQVRSAYLENTINGVIFAESRLEHFPPAHKSGFDETIPNKDSVLAVKKALRGENSAGACLYFNTSPFKGKTIFKVIDGVYFCY